MSTLILTAVAMLAFAGNSLICRLALAQELVDPATFATVRVLSGAAMLGLIVLLRQRPSGRTVDWRSVGVLFAYNVTFALAYVSLNASAGALILFGAAQVTMFFVAIRSGERFTAISWAGLVLAVIGLVYLVMPGLEAPDPLGAALMTVAGIAWGGYSLLGLGPGDPLRATAYNFLYTSPPMLLVSVVFASAFHATPAGLALAVTSGAVTSGLGYVVWYAALSGLTAGRAATVQLSVPVIAAFGGALLLSETITLRLLLAAAATLGGVAIVLGQRAPAFGRSPRRW